MIKEIYLVPHSHTDIGYTHPQPTIFELHRRFLDEALDITEATSDRTDGTAFKWMIEVAGMAMDWWQRASSSEKDRLLAAAKAGRVEIAGMRWNMAHLSDHHMLVEAMEPVRILREAGFPIRSAMNTDVNGLNWGLVNVMSDYGIDNLSMAINEHFGHAATPRPQAFNWLSPDNKSLLIYNGLIYGSSVSGWLGIPADFDKTRREVPHLVQVLESRGYPHSVLIMQATNVRYCDNNAPNPALPDYVRRYNAEGGPVSMRIATLSEAFDRLRQDDLSTIPVQRGDWPDWWTFGGGSSTRETGVLLTGERALRDAQQLAAWGSSRQRRSRDLELEASEALALYAEHTYTADRAAKKPDSPEVDIQLHWKKGKAYEGLSLARMLRRDGLAGIAKANAGDQRCLLVHNPLPWQVQRNLKVPTDEVMEHLFDPASHVVQRQDVEFGDYGADQMRYVPVDIPALGYVITPLSELGIPEGEVAYASGSLSNGKVDVAFDLETGGVTSFKVDGEEYAEGTAEYAFGVPVLEYPDPQLRTSIYGPPNFNDLDAAIDMHSAWHTDWTAIREAGRLTGSRSRNESSFSEVIFDYSFSNGDRAEVAYRLTPGADVLEIDVVMHKLRIPEPHSYYLPMPMMDDGTTWTTHYETAGAVVELDKEQLHGSSQHFVPTQRFIRMQGGHRGLSVASPDLPLFQVGGFTFGRHERGSVKRDKPVLNAWLNNNYWDTNFEVTQSGPIRARFTLAPHKPESIGRSVQRILPYVAEPQFHALLGAPGGEQLLDIDANELILTGVEREDDVLRLFVVNCADEVRTLRLSGAALEPSAAWSITLDRRRMEGVEVSDGTVSVVIGARAWTGVELKLGPNRVG